MEYVCGDAVHACFDDRVLFRGCRKRECLFRGKHETGALIRRRGDADADDVRVRLRIDGDGRFDRVTSRGYRERARNRVRSSTERARKDYLRRFGRSRWRLCRRGFLACPYGEEDETCPKSNDEYRESDAESNHAPMIPPPMHSVPRYKTRDCPSAGVSGSVPFGMNDIQSSPSVPRTRGP